MHVKPRSAVEKVDDQMRCVISNVVSQTKTTYMSAIQALDEAESNVKKASSTRPLSYSQGFG